MHDDWQIDADLLDRWRSGDNQAGQQIYARHAGVVIRFFRTKVRDEIDDLVQDTFVRLVEGRDRIRDGRSIRVYVLRIAQRVLARHLRALVRGRELDPQTDSIEALQPGTTTLLVRKQEHRLLLEAMRRLPIEQQILLELRYFEGIPPKELAAIVDIPTSTMRGRVDSARKALRTIIAQLGASAALVASTVENLEVWAEEVRALESERGDFGC